jgi:RHS repeat-associated protein
VKNGSLTTYTCNNANQLVSEVTAGVTTTYSFDVNGNVIGKNVGNGAEIWNYGYDYHNRSVSAISNLGVVSAYVIDYDVRRISKTVNSAIQVFGYDGDDVIADYTSLGVATATYVNSLTIDSKLIRSDESNHWYLYDAQGSVKELVDDSGDIENDYVENAWGEDVPGAGQQTLTDRYQFTGREKDAESGLFYYRNRCLMPSTGRFMQKDPKGMPESPNRYIYLLNNPVNAVDPWGLQDDKDVPWYRQGILGEVAYGIEGGLETAGDFIENPGGTISQKIDEVTAFTKEAVKEIPEMAKKAVTVACPVLWAGNPADIPAAFTKEQDLLEKAATLHVNAGDGVLEAITKTAVLAASDSSGQTGLYEFGSGNDTQALVEGSSKTKLALPDQVQRGFDGAKQFVVSTLGTAAVVARAKAFIGSLGDGTVASKVAPITDPSRLLSEPKSRVSSKPFIRNKHAGPFVGTPEGDLISTNPRNLPPGTKSIMAMDLGDMYREVRLPGSNAKVAGKVESQSFMGGAIFELMDNPMKKVEK